MTQEDRNRRARQIEITGQVTAGTVGSGFGAAKVRDAYKADYPDSFKRGVKRLKRVSRSAGASPAQVKRISQIARKGTPGFIPLAAAATAAGVATGAHRYQQISTLRQRRRQPVAKADSGAMLGRLPRYVIHDRQRKRVVGMHDKDHFKVLDHDDSVRIVHRNRVRIPTQRSTSMSKSAFGVDHEIEKSILGASKKTRRAAGAAKAHLMIAGKYEAANKGRMDAVTAAAGTRFKSSTQLRRNGLNEARGHNSGTARFHRDQAAKLSKSAFGVDDDRETVEKKSTIEALKSKPGQNTRTENVKAGTAVGAAEAGAVIGGFGAHAARRNAKAGVRLLRSIPGAGPSKVGAARLVASHAARHGGRAALAGAAFGAPIGAYAGAITPAKKRSKR